MLETSLAANIVVWLAISVLKLNVELGRGFEHQGGILI